MKLFPAVLFIGPPHSGKSVLAYSLTQALRQRGVDHYVLRAAPDGEGDWVNQAAQKLVRTLRVKGDFTPAFVDFVCDSLAGRHLPLLVDAGGRPTPEQERIFDHCTHAILLTPSEDTRDQWRAMTARHNLFVVAELTSHREGQGHLSAERPVLRGVLTGLERGATASGPLFDALVERLATMLYHDPVDLRRIHENLCPVEIMIDLDRLARTLSVPVDGEQAAWEPQHLVEALDYLPQAVPLGLYGRGPNWLYAAVVLLAAPAPFVQFDVRLGWVPAQPLRWGTPAPQSPLQVRLDRLPDHVQVEGTLPIAYLDYSQLEDLVTPPIPSGAGVILGGKLPHWLYTSLALTYRDAPWIAVYQPQLKAAVVVYSTDPGYTLGQCIPWRRMAPLS